MSAITTRTLLYVEDEPDDAFFMRTAFERLNAGLDVRVVGDGPAAIAYLEGREPFEDRARNPLPALTLLDINLPGISGFEILEWIRGHRELKTMPVVIFSSSGRPEDRARAQELGANDYVMKPNSGVRFGEVARNLHATWFK